MENKPFYKNNLETMEVLIEYVFDYVKISEAQQYEEEIEGGEINEPQ
jgi:hypothetical protein